MQAALFTTIETFLRQGIIRKSTSLHYSQVLPVPKPDNTFRMCADYRALNDCTPDASWPIPKSIFKFLKVIGVVYLYHLIYESVSKHLLSMEKVTMV